jgi:L-iditol 2-dehydrogenase
MLQARMIQPGQVVFEEVEPPQAGPENILLKICEIGICGSDIHVYHGKHPYTSYPVI